MRLQSLGPCGRLPGTSGDKRAFWLRFALIGSAYLGFSLVPSIEPRLITTPAMAFLDLNVPRSNAVTFYDPLVVTTRNRTPSMSTRGTTHSRT